MPRLSRELQAGPEDSGGSDDALHKRLENERQAVLRCVAAEANVTHVGQRIEHVSHCVPRATDPTRVIPSKKDLFDAVIAGKVRALNDTEARFAGQSARYAGLDRLVLTNPDIIRHNKQLYDEGHKETVAAVTTLLKEAENMLEMPVDTIPDKAYVPPDGDKRSYVSLATYCWPANPDDLENPKGPWECRDGEPFPGRNIIAPDFNKLTRVQRNSFNLALAWFFSRDHRFAKHCSEIIRAFFIDPQTGMRPHLRYAQLSPISEREAGEPYGTIDNKAMAMVFDAIAIVSESTWWLPEDSTRMSQWASEYVLHLQSDHITAEVAQQNNHGTLYDVQYMAFLRFLGRDEKLWTYIDTNVKPRLRGQIFGSTMPQEMIRPISYAYHNFILEAYLRLAMQAERAKVDLWSVGGDTGNSMMDAWDWMAQHWCDRSETLWPVEQLKDAKLDMDRPVGYAGAMFAHASARASEANAYTLRSRFYALSWHSFRAGPDPQKYVRWNFALTRQLSFVKFDDCFITTCPERRVLQEDPPTYDAFCLPGPGEPMPYLDAFRGRWPDALNATADIKPALVKGDPLPVAPADSAPPPPTDKASADPGTNTEADKPPATPTEGTNPVDEGAAKIEEDEGSQRSTPSTEEGKQAMAEDAGGDKGGAEESKPDEESDSAQHREADGSGDSNNKGDSAEERESGERGDSNEKHDSAEERESGERGDSNEKRDSAEETESGERGDSSHKRDSDERRESGKGGTLGAHDQDPRKLDGQLELESARHASAVPDTGADTWVATGLQARDAAWDTMSWQVGVPSAALLALLLLVGCLLRHRAAHRFRKIA